MPCFDLGLEVHTETFTNVSSTGCTPLVVNAPVGKKFVSASSRIEASGWCSTAGYVLSDQPCDDLDEWHFYIQAVGGSQPGTADLVVKLVMIDA